MPEKHFLSLLTNIPSTAVAQNHKLFKLKKGWGRPCESSKLWREETLKISLDSGSDGQLKHIRIY